MAAGRPWLTVGGQPITSELVHGAHARASGYCAAIKAENATLSRSLRDEIAEGWTKDGMAEHASIASFSKFALGLMSVSAPANLLEGAHLAALDEIKHAKLCFGLAAAYSNGSRAAPGPFPVPTMATCELSEFAAATVREGCVGETLSALTAAQQLRELKPTSPQSVRSALRTISADEARHAALAWETVAWALRTGGAKVAASVDAAFREALQLNAAGASSAQPGADATMLEFHGRISTARAGNVRASYGATIAAMRDALVARKGSNAAAAVRATEDVSCLKGAFAGLFSFQ